MVAILAIPPKISVSEFVGIVKGRTAIRVLRRFKRFKAYAVLGQSSLDQRVLCRYGGYRCM